MTKRLAAVAACAVLAIAGCVSSDNSAPSPSATSAPGGGTTVIAPTMIDPRTTTSATVPLGSMIVMTVDDPGAWTAVVSDPSIATFQPGGTSGGAEMNPGFVPVAEGQTTATVTAPDGTTYTLSITVKGKVGDDVIPPSDLTPSAETTALADSLIGMSEKDALAKVEATGRVIRIARRDAESFPLTMDYRPDRINIEVDGGIVTKTDIS